MKAAEKIAAVLLPVMREQAGALEVDEMWWMQGHAADYAKALIAAFPQLALEGRERHVWIDPDKYDDRIVDVPASKASHVCTVYTSPWSEVQS